LCNRGTAKVCCPSDSHDPQAGRRGSTGSGSTSTSAPEPSTGTSSGLFILFALEYWNNLLWPLIVFLDRNNMPLAVGLAGVVNQYRIQYDLLLAGSALATLPIIVLFFILRRQFMEGASFTGTGVQ
jgi:hypothetical protein